MNKDMKKILLVLALFSLSGGIFYNFEQLWMQENALSVKTISTVFSLASIITIATLFICSRLVRKDKLKDFTCGLIVVKSLMLFGLFLLHKSGLTEVIKFLCMIEFAIDVEIFVCIYPMMAQIDKNDKLYASRGIIYDALYYLGVLITCFLVGRNLVLLKIDYNTFNLLGALVMLIAYFALKSVKLDSKKKDNIDASLDHKDFSKKILHDKITIFYLLFTIFSNAAYFTLNGMLLLIFTEGLKMEANSSSLLLMILGITSVIIGIIILEKLTLKNDYINLAIKFVGRTLLFLLAFIFDLNVFYLIAIIFTKLISDSYTHISDAPYINRYKTKEQFSLSNLAEGFKYLGRAIGVLICGLALGLGIRYCFLGAFVCGVFNILFAYLALYYRKKETNDRVQKSY